MLCVKIFIDSFDMGQLLNFFCITLYTFYSLTARNKTYLDSLQ